MMRDRLAALLHPLCCGIGGERRHYLLEAAPMCETQADALLAHGVVALAPDERVVTVEGLSESASAMTEPTTYRPDFIGECRISGGHIHAFTGPHRFNESHAVVAALDAGDAE